MILYYIYPILLNFRACGPEASEYCQELGNEPQRAGMGWRGRAVVGVKADTDRPGWGLSGTCQLTQLELREVPGDPGQTQNAYC
jgi:hypothetical protein